MTLPNSKEREDRLQKQLDSNGPGNVNNKELLAELQLIKLDRLKNETWYKSPTFWVAAVAALASCIAAYAALFPPHVSP